MNNTQTPERPHATVATIIERNGQYLLVEELRDGKVVYNQPAGHIENGESANDAAIRETLEETGWDVEPTHIGGFAIYHAPNGISYFRTTIIARPIQERDNVTLDEGILRAVWMSYEEVIAHRERLRSPIVLKVIEDYRAGIRYPLDLIYEHG